MTTADAPTREEARPGRSRTGTDLVRGALRPLQAGLFPEPPDDRRTPARRRRDAAVTALAALLGVLVVALRLPVDSWDSLWAEDGTLFLQQALDQPLWKTFGTPYAGYLNGYPRLSTAVVMSLPLAAAGVTYTVLAAVAVVWVAWTAWISSAGQVGSRWLRAVLASAVLLIPAGALEAAGNVSNSHFFLVFGAYWALVGRPRSRAAIVSANALVLMATLSDPICAALLPLAILRFACLRGWRDRSVALSYAIGMLLQVLVALQGGRPTGPPSDLRNLVFAYGFRIVSPSFLGLRATDSLVVHAGPGVLKYLTALFLVAVLAWFAVARHLRLALAAVVIASVGVWVVTSRFSLHGGYPPTGPERLNLVLASRYTIFPSLLLVTAWILAAEGVLRRAGPRLRTLILVIAVAPVAVYGVTGFRPPYSIRPELPPWSEQVRQAEQGCSSSPAVEPPLALIAPGDAWVVELECADLG